MMNRPGPVRRLRLVLPLLLAVGGCDQGDISAADRFAEDGAEDRAGDDAMPPPADGPGASDEGAASGGGGGGGEGLLGVWAQVTRVTVMQKVPVADPFANVTRSYGVAEIVRAEGGGLSLRERYCHLDLTSVGAVSISVPDAWTTSMPIIEAPLDPAGEGRWERQEIHQPVGARLEDPVHDPLPTEPDDPRVFDQDGDGRPGVTAYLGEAAEIYLVRKERYRFDVNEDGPDRLFGHIVDTSEQVTLGAEPPMFDMPIEMWPHEDPDESTVELLRLEGPTACEELVPRIPELFPDG